MPAPAIEWNSSFESAAERYWTTELNDELAVPLGGHVSIWTASTDGSRLEQGHSSLDPIALEGYRGRTYYGRDQWSSNGRGTVMLCSPTGGAACKARDDETGQPSTRSAPPAAAAVGWWAGPNLVACGFPECCAEPLTAGCHRPSKHPLIFLGNASTGVKTADDCEELCIGRADCTVWQVSARILGRRTAHFPIFPYSWPSRMALPKILVLTPLPPPPSRRWALRREARIARWCKE